MADPTGMTGENAILNDVSPPPPPPPPPDEQSLMAETVSSALGGGVLAAAGSGTGFIGAAWQEAGPALAQSGETSTFMIILLGAVAGAIFGLVRSFSFNMIITNSSGVREFRRRYPQAKDVPYNELTYFYIHRKFEVFWEFLKENCCKDQPGKSGPASKA